MRRNKGNRYGMKMRCISIMLMVVFSCQLFAPNVSLALTTGPTQPEVQGFEPVGTTDMVDMFSGSFVYNIPLLDVEGYPVNISYHGGVTMEQEASWVGLGWNINPGSINRTIRGVPDDFNGDSLFKDFNIKPEKTLRVGMGAGGELAGVGDPALKLSADLGANLTVNNYRGISCDFSLGGGINMMGVVSAGVNLGVGSQTGAAIGYTLGGLLVASSRIISKDYIGAALNPSIGGGYSTRTGVKDMNLNYSGRLGNIGFSSKNIIPIGVKNYVPVITNSSTIRTIFGRIKLGGELFGGYLYGNVNAMFNTLTYKNDASRDAYGFMYLQNARLNNSSILDFTRDKDGSFNKSMQYLPVPNMTYDIYNLSGQGTGGIFRPFRNDFGNVYDPATTSTGASEKGELEAGLGNVFEAGWDYTHSGTEISSGPWSTYQRSGTLLKGFTKETKGKLYENVYFKAGGELTAVNPAFNLAIGGMDPIVPDEAMALPTIKPGSDITRDPRANLIYYHTAEEDTMSGVSFNSNILSYSGYGSESFHPTSSKIKRIGKGNFQRKKHQISEIVQVQKDGRIYIYGIPAMNNVEREVTFSVDPTTSTNHLNLGDGMVTFDRSTDGSHDNVKGVDHYYNSTVTPSYSHSYLLTSVLSTDYRDLTGNGPSDDDLGSFTKFNYTRTDSDYRWVAPYSVSFDSAQYNPGFWSDPRDDKASFVCGSREQWNLSSVETKNFIAEFYTSPRHDALGITKAILNTSATSSSIFNSDRATAPQSYKLDSIKLYNKHDRFINGSSAVPVKTVFFVYDYSLCPGVPNSDAGMGKLTLKKIYFSYGSSQKSMISPYHFGYAVSPGQNPAYSLCSKNRWGDYKPNLSSFTNYEFPYVNQNDLANDNYAGAWSLTQIVLPSGGTIEAQYESNDYAFVQDKPVNEMFMVAGIGNSPAFISDNMLSNSGNKLNSPNLYAYFLRRPGNELPNLSFAQNYLGKNFQTGGKNCMYFNFNVALTGANNTYEQVKGYANVSETGICSNNPTYGYIKFISVTPQGDGANLNPVTYTALNVGRYNLPQIVFPGYDPNESDLKSMLAGLKISFKGLINIGTNPLISLIDAGGGQNVNLSKSYIRLQSVGLCKKGGGQRVKRLEFYDSWNAMVGAGVAGAIYGKNYDYTINDSSFYGKISSGVASYEPLIGGDENPLRQPVPYIVQSGSNWPPNDPVELYQETPIGESLFPSAQVGYSNVTVTSIHADIGKSSQGVDIYQFYTAKDFPAQFISTAINSISSNHFDFFTQKNSLSATQGYTLIFNDMHGKPKKVEHDVYNQKSKKLQPISYQIYNYRQKGNKLNNTVKCIAYDGSNMVVKDQQLGIEEDVTLDSRQKDEITNNSTLNGNFNFFIIPFLIPIPVPIPYSFTWTNESENEFQSAAVTKVVQQYGILDNVQSYNEGAVTTMQNEIFDPQTGQAVVTSVTNEFRDKEYSTNIPAWWVYKGMGPSYKNIGYRDTGTITVGQHNIGTLSTLNTAPLVAGDQLSVSYTDASNQKHNTVAWVLGKVPLCTTDTETFVTPTSHYDTSYTIVRSHQYCFSNIPVLLHSGSYSISYHPCLPYDSAPTVFVSSYGFCTILDTCMRSYNPDSVYNLPVHCPIYGYAYQYYECSSIPFDTIILEDFTMTLQYNNGYMGAHGLYGSRTVWGHTWNFYSESIEPMLRIDTNSYDTIYHYAFSHLTSDTSTRIVPAGMCSGLNILPRFPQNTPGWTDGALLSNVSIKVIHSGQTNMLTDNIESYTSMDYPISSGSNKLNNSLTNLINLQSKTFADSNTMIPYNYISNADTINPWAIGERGIWRLYTEYAYKTDRDYAGVTSRNSGLFKATSMLAAPSGLPADCFLTPFNYLAPDFSDPNWHATQTITKYSPYGKELENMDALGNYSTAVFGYNQELPVAVASNAKQGDIFTDGFEDYNLLRYNHNIINYKYSFFDNFLSSVLTDTTYDTLNVHNYLNPLSLVNYVAHTGTHSILIPSSGGSAIYNGVDIPVNLNAYTGMVNYYNIYFPCSTYAFTSANEYLPFKLCPGKTYVLSYWLLQPGAVPNITGYPISDSCSVIFSAGGVPFAGVPVRKKTNIIDGWQQVEATFTVPVLATSSYIALPANYYMDDMRIFPSNANMKSFVYNPYSEKLMATLDENNFATFYEYDQEGSLIRVKKETSKGIMSVSESRSGNQKH